MRARAHPRRADGPHRGAGPAFLALAACLVGAPLASCGDEASMARPAAKEMWATPGASSPERPEEDDDGEGEGDDPGFDPAAAPPGPTVDAAVLAEYALDFWPLSPGTYAYNPALIDHGAVFVSVVRLETLSPVRGRRLANRLAATVIDRQGRVLAPLRPLATPYKPGDEWTAEDARLIRHRDAVWMVYNQTLDGRLEGERRLRLARLEIDDRGPPAAWQFRLADDRQLEYLPAGQARPRLEKNWSPFVHEDALCFLYQSNPIVAVCLDDAQLWRDAPQLVPTLRGAGGRPAPWAWGEVRGGTPATFVAELQRYVTFFHSHKVLRMGGKKARRHYFTGFYAFSPAPPFAIEAMAKGPVLTRFWLADRDIAEWHIAFAEGAVWTADKVFVAYGRNDRESALMVLDRATLLSELTPTLAARL